MAIYSVLGDTIVEQEELYDNARELANVKDALEDGGGTTTVELSTGQVTTENLIERYTVATGERVPFEPVGIGKPLTIEIRHVYTGRFPEANFWGARTAEMMVTSAIKSIATFNAAPPRVKLLRKEGQPQP